jgi:hypothetical protein
MKLYTTIDDLPAFNWFKCIESKDYSYCMVNRKECSKNDLLKCEEAFGIMYAEYVDVFGISDPLNDIIALQNELLVLKIDKALTKDNFYNTLIEMKQIEIDAKLKNQPSKNNTHKIAIEKYLGIRVDMKAISVREYYEYLEELKKDNG